MDLYSGLRQRMVNYLKEKGISDPLVLNALLAVERHKFVDSYLMPHAYEDTALQIGCEQTISQPSTVATQSQLLEIKPNEKVLEIGTGSGYQSAVLSSMGANVYSIERHYDLYKKTSALLEKIDRKIKVFYGDGFEGRPTQAPFDKILITCGAPELPKALLEQLKIGGIMVIPLGEGEQQQMLRIIKTGEDSFSHESYGTCKFVPMLRETNSNVK